MVLKKIIMLIIIVLSLFIIGGFVLSTSDYSRDKYIEVILKHKSIDIENVNDINNILKSINGGNYYKGSNISDEYGEKTLQITYSMNKNLGEGDYINYWNEIDKKEIVISNAVYMFVMSDELKKIKIRLDDSIDEEFVVNRNDVEEVYNIALENYKISEESLLDLIRKDKIEELWYLVNG